MTFTMGVELERARRNIHVVGQRPDLGNHSYYSRLCKSTDEVIGHQNSNAVLVKKAFLSSLALERIAFFGLKAS